jgi:hypothetical protein
METIYFPACGFGFWYLLGKYEHIREIQSNYLLSGSSAGSLICMCSLVDCKEEPFMETILQMAAVVLPEYTNRTNFINVHIIVDMFIFQLVKRIDETTERTRQQLKRIRIQTTIFHPPCWFEKRQTTPTSISHLRDLCLASCYIPFVSNVNNRLTYLINGEHHIDGGFIDLYIPHMKTFCGISSYRGLRIPSRQNAIEMRNIAYNEPFIINRVIDSRVWICSPYLIIIFLYFIIYTHLKN